jgi:hypothetical protein
MFVCAWWYTGGRWGSSPSHLYTELFLYSEELLFVTNAISRAYFLFRVIVYSVVEVGAEIPDMYHVSTYEYS